MSQVQINTHRASLGDVRTSSSVGTCVKLAALVIVFTLPFEGRVVHAQDTEVADDARGTLKGFVALQRHTKLDYAQFPVSEEYELPEPNQRRKMEERQSLLDKRIPFQIGSRQSVPLVLLERMSQSISDDWMQLDDGSIVKSITINSRGASSLRVAMLSNLPYGGEFRFFSPHLIRLGEENHTAEFLETRSANLPVITQNDFHIENGKQEPLWSPTIGGDTLGIEISLPSWSALRNFTFEIADVSRMYAPMSYLLGDLSKSYCDNQINVTCRSERISWGIIETVVRIQFIDDGDSFLCSGTMLNDKDATKHHFFLTANHCVSTPQVARTVEAIWFDQQADCNVERRSLEFIRTSPRARLVATRVPQDSTLLEFSGALPGDYSRAGWSSEYIRRDTNVYGVHHPRGAVKKYSSGKVIGRPTEKVCGDPDDGSTCFVVEGSIEVDWDEGATEPGSSGSGLFVEGTLVGVLSARRGSCKDAISFYGSFSDFLPVIEELLLEEPVSELP